MPIFFQQDIDSTTRLAVWKIDEEESFFRVPLQRNITHPHKRLQHLAGRYLLLHLFPQFPLHLIKIADTRKPFLEDEAFHFSISHCGDYAAAIVSRNKRVGVDIEIPTPRVERIKTKFLHADELQVVSNGRPPQTEEEKADPINLLTLLWSAKEAVFKWWSYGNVDFSEMIRLTVPELVHEGEMRTRFLSAERVYDLTLHYRFFDKLCLAWVMD